MLTLAGSAPRRARGNFPSVSINRNGTIVEAHQPSSSSTTMYYQIGTINKTDVNFYEERPIVGSGKYPNVAINDNNRVIEVHEGARTHTRKVYYNVGPLESQRIQWQDRSMLLAPGRFPAVAVRGNRVVVTRDRALFRNSTYYHVGTINEGGTAIEWGNKHALFEGSAMSHTAVAINDEFAVAVGRGFSRIACRVGRFPDGEAKNIDWFNEISLGDNVGICPKICLDDAGCTVMVWYSRFLKQLTYTEGELKQRNEQWVVEWQQSRNYDNGVRPAIAIAPNNGQVIEEHETNFGSTLHVHVGRYDRQLGGLVDQSPTVSPQQQQPSGEDEDEELPGGEMEHVV
jgi:hypothetical protein